MHPTSSGGTAPRTPYGNIRLPDRDTGYPSPGETAGPPAQRSAKKARPAAGKPAGPAGTPAGPPGEDGYPRFRAAVAHAQLAGWLPGGRRFLLDISGPGAHTAEIAAGAGHRVLRLVGSGAAGLPAGPPPARHYPAGGRLDLIAADDADLTFLPDDCADGVIAENGTLSRHLAAEELVKEIARVLRPGGQLFAGVDSLTYGMAMLAEQHRWPSLVDVLNADVVLIPWPDGTMTRCYGAEQLRELLTGAGLEVSWIRPRTVLSPQTVSYLLARDPSRFTELVRAELRARADDSVGTQLIACGVRP